MKSPAAGRWRFAWLSEASSTRSETTCFVAGGPAPSLRYGPTRCGEGTLEVDSRSVGAAVGRRKVRDGGTRRRVRVPLHHHAIQIVLEVTYPRALPPSASECVRNSASTVQGHFRLGRLVDSSRCRRAPEDRQARISAVAPLGIGAPSCCPPCHPPCHPPCRRWHRGSRNRARIDRHHSFETNTPLRRSAWASSEAPGLAGRLLFPCLSPCSFSSIPSHSILPSILSTILPTILQVDGRGGLVAQVAPLSARLGGSGR